MVGQTATLKVSVQIAVEEAQQKFKKFSLFIGNSVAKGITKGMHSGLKTSNFKKDISNLQKEIGQKIKFKPEFDIKDKRKPTSILSEQDLQIKKQTELNNLYKKSSKTFGQFSSQAEQARNKYNEFAKSVGGEQIEKMTANNPKVIRQIQDLAREYNFAKQNLGKHSEATKLAKQRLDEFAKSANVSRRAVAGVTKATRTMNFDFLTLLFAGMMLQRTMKNLWTGIISGYKETVGMNSAFNKSTQKLGASFNYLKFAIANALNNPMFVGAIEKVTDFFEWLGDWVSENPNVVSVLIGLGGALFVLGTISVLASSIIQLKMLLGILKGLAEIKWLMLNNGLKTFTTTMIIWGTMAWAKISTGIAGVVTAIKGLTLASLAPWALVGVIIAGGLYLAYKINQKNLDNMGLDVTGFFNNIISVAITFVTGFANIFNLGITGILGILLGLGAGIKIIFDGVVETAKQAWNSIKAGFFAIWSGDDISDAMSNAFDTDAIKAKVKTAFEDAKSAMIDLGDISGGISTSINQWGYDKQIEWAGAVKTGAEEQSTLNQEILTAQENYLALNTGLIDLNSTTEDTINVSKLLNETINMNIVTLSNYTTSTEKLNKAVDNLYNSLSNLNGKTFTYTIKEKRVSSGSSISKSQISTTR